MFLTPIPEWVRLNHPFKKPITHGLLSLLLRRNTPRKQPEQELVYFGSKFEGTVHRGGRGIVEGTRCWREAEKDERQSLNSHLLSQSMA